MTRLEAALAEFRSRPVRLLFGPEKMIPIVPRLDETIERSTARFAFTGTPQQVAYKSVIGLHHVQEIYARRCAQTLVRNLRAAGMRPFAYANGYLRGVAKQYQITKDHVNLFLDIVRETIDSDQEG